MKIFSWIIRERGSSRRRGLIKAVVRKEMPYVLVQEIKRHGGR